MFYKRHYSEKVVPALQKFKFNHFGHDHVVLHENEIRKENTVIIIAHRYSMVRDADHVIVLSGGEVLEQGEPAELIIKGGWFADFADAADNEPDKPAIGEENEDETIDDEDEPDENQ